MNTSVFIKYRFKIIKYCFYDVSIHENGYCLQSGFLFADKRTVKEKPLAVSFMTTGKRLSLNRCGFGWFSGILRRATF